MAGDQPLRALLRTLLQNAVRIGIVPAIHRENNLLNQRRLRFEQQRAQQVNINTQQYAVLAVGGGRKPLKQQRRALKERMVSGQDQAGPRRRQLRLQGVERYVTAAQHA